MVEGSARMATEVVPIPLHQPSAGPPPHLPMGRNRVGQLPRGLIPNPTRISAAKSAGRIHDCHRTRSRRSGARSEEHTSELQSLMRISYAVFCLKKKNTTKRQQ